MLASVVALSDEPVHRPVEVPPGGFNARDVVVPAVHVQPASDATADMGLWTPRRRSSQRCALLREQGVASSNLAAATIHSDG